MSYFMATIAKLRQKKKNSKIKSLLKEIATKAKRRHLTLDAMLSELNKNTPQLIDHDSQ